MTEDHRKRPRRRGQALEEAILKATLEEIAAVGYESLRMERVAERARTGKASVYRRWPGKVALVLAAAYHALPDPADVGDTGTLRGDLIAVIGSAVDVVSGLAGLALRGLISDALLDPEAAKELDAHALNRTAGALREAVRRAHDRGEVDIRRITEMQLDAAVLLARYHLLARRGPVSLEMVTRLVDEIALPLLLASRSDDDPIRPDLGVRRSGGAERGMLP